MMSQTCADCSILLPKIRNNNTQASIEFVNEPTYIFYLLNDGMDWMRFNAFWNYGTSDWGTYYSRTLNKLFLWLEGLNEEIPEVT